MVFAEGLHGNAERIPAHGPVDAPDEFSLAFGVVAFVDMPAGTSVFDDMSLGVVLQNFRVAYLSAAFADGVEGHPVVGEFSLRDSLENLFDFGGILKNGLNLFGVFAAPVKFARTENLGFNVQLFERL